MVIRLTPSETSGAISLLARVEPKNDTEAEQAKVIIAKLVLADQRMKNRRYGSLTER